MSAKTNCWSWLDCTWGLPRTEAPGGWGCEGVSVKVRYECEVNVMEVWGDMCVTMSHTHTHTHVTSDTINNIYEDRTVLKDITFKLHYYHVKQQYKLRLNHYILNSTNDFPPFLFPYNSRFALASMCSEVLKCLYVHVQQVPLGSSARAWPNLALRGTDTRLSCIIVVTRRRKM